MFAYKGTAQKVNEGKIQFTSNAYGFGFTMLSKALVEDTSGYIVGTNAAALTYKVRKLRPGHIIFIDSLADQKYKDIVYVTYQKGGHNFALFDLDYDKDFTNERLFSDSTSTLQNIDLTIRTKQNDSLCSVPVKLTFVKDNVQIEIKKKQKADFEVEGKLYTIVFTPFGPSNVFIAAKEVFDTLPPNFSTFYEKFVLDVESAAPATATKRVAFECLSYDFAQSELTYTTHPASQTEGVNVGQSWPKVYKTFVDVQADTLYDANVYYFTAHWCGPCVPELGRAREVAAYCQANKIGFYTVVARYVGDDQTVYDYMAKSNLPGKVIYADPVDKPSMFGKTKYGLNFPSYYLVNKQGLIVETSKDRIVASLKDFIRQP
jgi:hypothetical protein